MNDISISLNIPTLILFSITLLVIGVCLFFIGYFLGKQASYGVSNIVVERPKGFFDKNETTSKQQNKITIDDTKFVTDIRTDNLEKKYEQLGDIKKSEENITSSVDKLKNMKR